MLVVRTTDSFVQEYEFDEEVGMVEAQRRVMEHEVEPTDEYHDWNIDAWVE